MKKHQQSDKNSTQKTFSFFQKKKFNTWRDREKLFPRGLTKMIMLQQYKKYLCLYLLYSHLLKVSENMEKEREQKSLLYNFSVARIFLFFPISLKVL